MTGRVDRRAFLLFAPAMGLAMVARGAPSAAIPLATDLRADGRDSKARKVPILILFSLPGCPFCEIVRRSHLAPMLRDPTQARRAILRQIDIDGDHTVIGFSGAPTTHATLARAHDVRSAPVVAFWDGNGKPVAESLVGMLLPDFYAVYLESALDAAREGLASRS